MPSLATSRTMLPRLALLVAVYLIFAARVPSFHTAAGLAALIDGAVLAGLVAVGVGLTMIAGEMDLSVGSMAALAGIAAVQLFPLGMVPALLIVVTGCALLGTAQGWLIHRLEISSMVLTVGTLIGLRGVALIVSGEKTALIPLDRIGSTDILAAKLGIVSIPSLALLLVVCAAAWFTRYTLWGREIFAIGGGRAEARAAGVLLRRPIVVAFSISAALAGFAGALLSMKQGSASPLGYDAVVLEAVTACLIGGVSLAGGRGSIVGIVVGLFTMRILIGGIALLGAPFWAQSLATGLLLVLVILIEATIRHLERRSRQMQSMAR